MSVEQLYTIADLARLAQQSRRTIERRIASGEIKTRRLPGSRAVRITAREVELYLGRGLPSDVTPIRRETP